MIQTAKPDVLMLQLAEECPEAPVGALRRALQRAVRTFSNSGLLETWMTVPTQCNVAGYPLEEHICDGMSIKFIRNVEWCGTCLRCVEDCKGCQTGYRVDDLHHITLVGSSVPGRNALDDLRVQVVLKPLNDQCDLPVDLLEEYEEDLFAGAMSYLLRQRKKDWSDPRAAREYKDEFDGGLASAKCLAATSHKDQEARIKPAFCI